MSSGKNKVNSQPKIVYSKTTVNNSPSSPPRQLNSVREDSTSLYTRLQHAASERQDSDVQYMWQAPQRLWLHEEGQRSTKAQGCVVASVCQRCAGSRLATSMTCCASAADSGPATNVASDPVSPAGCPSSSWPHCVDVPQASAAIPSGGAEEPPLQDNQEQLRQPAAVCEPDHRPRQPQEPPPAALQQSVTLPAVFIRAHS